jgi:hypothetical protein
MQTAAVGNVTGRAIAVERAVLGVLRWTVCFEDAVVHDPYVWSAAMLHVAHISYYPFIHTAGRAGSTCLISDNGTLRSTM